MGSFGMHVLVINLSFYNGSFPNLVRIMEKLPHADVVAMAT